MVIRNKTGYSRSQRRVSSIGIQVMQLTGVEVQFFGKGGRMSGYKKTVISFVLVFSLLISPLPVLPAAAKNIRGEQTSPGVMTVDLLLCRPLGLVAMLGGTVVFVVSSPFSALGGNFEEAWNSLVVNPAQYTFMRPLGEFE